MAVYGAARGHAIAKETPSLMADMYGFTSEEEMSDTKAYLCSHGDYQLEQVGVKRLVTLLCFSVSALVTLVVARGGEATSHLLLFKFLFKSIFLVTWGGGSHWYYCPLLSFQVDGAGNCLFSALKKSMAVWTANNTDHTYFPNRYFRRMVVNYMVNHRQLIYNKFSTLMALYSVEEEVLDLQRGWTPPLSFKEYLRQLLYHDFWGDDVVLYVVSCMWNMKVTVLNTKTLQEYRIQHDCHLNGADAAVTYNANNHFNTASK